MLIDKIKESKIAQILLVKVFVVVTLIGNLYFSS